MKKFLVLIVLFLGIAISVNAQVQTYRTTGYYEKKLYSWCWEYSGTTRDSDGDVTATFYFYDQDNDRGTMRLVIRANGQSQLYIDFANVMWAYDVYRTN